MKLIEKYDFALSNLLGCEEVDNIAEAETEEEITEYLIKREQKENRYSRED